VSAEEQIKQQLADKFGLAADAIRIPRPRRLFMELAQAEFEKAFVFAKEELKFTHLVSITGLDEQSRLVFIYHMAQDSGIVLNIRTGVNKDNPVFKTVTKYFPGAEIYERELVDLFGATAEGLPEGNRYPLTDDWPAGQYPLRKDWKQTG
jgi:membrane-bound hydrogenase subunit beta